MQLLLYLYTERFSAWPSQDFLGDSRLTDIISVVVMPHLDVVAWFYLHPSPCLTCSIRREWSFIYPVYKRHIMSIFISLPKLISKPKKLSRHSIQKVKVGQLCLTL